MSTIIVEAIREGSFPDDDKTLNSTIDSKTIPTLLEEVQKAKQELSIAVTSIGEDEAGNVDEWISQAKKIQGDIVKCKEDAREIVKQHEHLESLRAARDEVQHRADLIEEEIAFNSTLQQQINSISETNHALQQVDRDIATKNIQSVSQALIGLESTIANIRSEQAQSLLKSLCGARVNSFASLLRQALNDNCSVTSSTDSVEFRIRKNHGMENGPYLDLTEVVECLDQLGELEDARTTLAKRIDNVLLPHLHQRSKMKITATHMNEDMITIQLSTTTDFTAITKSTKSIIQYLSDTLPDKLSSHILQQLSAKAFQMLIDSWLDPAIPAEINDLETLDSLRQSVESLYEVAKACGIAEASILKTWIQNLPNAWFNKRKTISLDVVRKAFTLAKGTRIAVARTETQSPQSEDQNQRQAVVEDDWSENWDDDADTQQKSRDVTEDESDAWGFSADEDDSKNPAVKGEPEDDDGEAWGWGDEDDTSPKVEKRKESTTKPKPDPVSNGIVQQNTSQQPTVLTETYHVTDVPDYILEQVGKDNADVQVLKDPSSANSFKFLTETPDIDSLIQSTLSMYRAIGPSYYIEGTPPIPSLTTMNLYNDSLYLSQKLSEHPELSQSLLSEIQALQKFARQVYTTELATQRQILSDLMDNAQGFIDCTREPNTSVCETAISSTVDYIRTLHKQWSSILSASHTAQSVGSLLSSTMSKMIKDIEDMEDISEAQSQKLVSFMENVGKTEDLFLPDAHESILDQQASSSLALLYVPSYLRFNYLQQILESSLVDIKYMWTDAGLSIEFTSEEVIDLIKALFAESSHRRNAINAIRS